jgi:hypothetical protein
VTQTFAVWIVVLVAFSAANFPFISQRLFGAIATHAPKTLGMRLGEMIVYYFLAGGLALFLENRAGQIAPQTWEFYAITATLFVTFSFPGFVYRYLFKHRD